MDEKDVKENLRITYDTIEFMTFEDKVMLVSALQSSVPNWNQACIDEYNRVKDLTNS